MIGSLCVYGRKRGKMETWYYEVVSIDGDYANLKRTDIFLGELRTK